MLMLVCTITAPFDDPHVADVVASDGIGDISGPVPADGRAYRDRDPLVTGFGGVRVQLYQHKQPGL